MPRYYQVASLPAGVALSCLVNAASFSSSSLSAPDQIDRTQIAETYGRLPLSFEANQGQTDTPVKFFSRGPGYRLFLTPHEAVLSLTSPRSPVTEKREATQHATIRMQFVGANPSPEIAGQSPLPNKTHYLLGDDRTKHVTDVPNYAAVRYDRLYPGIDVVFYGNQRNLEYDLLLAPGADLSAVKLRMQGVDAAIVNAQGDLVLRTPLGEITQHRPIAYQLSPAGERTPIDAGYVVTADNEIGFQLGDYDRTSPVVIDPVLTYATFFGGTGPDRINAIAVDSAGNAYVIGTTMSANFPLVNQYDRSLESGGADAFVAKLNAAGSALVYSTYLGGRYGSETGNGIAVDSAGNAYVAGAGAGSDFPVTTGAVRMTGGAGFITKLNPQGKSLLYSAIIAATPTALAIDTTGNAYLTGTDTTGFVTAAGAYRPAKPSAASIADAFVAKLNAAGTALVYATYLGGTQGSQGAGIAVDASGNAYLIGQTGSTDYPTLKPLETAPPAGTSTTFITKLNAAGSALVYSTYFGGVNGATGSGIAVDGGGFAYVTGQAKAGFPLRNAFQSTLAGSQDAFVAKLTAAGNGLVYASYLGGSQADGGHRIAVDADGNAYVSGYTTSNDLPLLNPIQTTRKNAASAAPTGFVAKVSQKGLLLYTTYLGGAGSVAGDNLKGIAVDGQGNVFVAGYTDSTDFPVTAGALKTTMSGTATQGVIAKLSTAQIAVTLQSAAPAIEAGQAVTLTAAAAPKSGGGTLSGSITFVDGQTPLAGGLVEGRRQGNCGGLARQSSLARRR